MNGTTGAEEIHGPPERRVRSGRFLDQEIFGNLIMPRTRPMRTR